MSMDALAELDAIIATARDSPGGIAPPRDAEPGIIEPPPPASKGY